MAMANVVAEWAKESYEIAVKIAYENGVYAGRRRDRRKIAVR